MASARLSLLTSLGAASVLVANACSSTTNYYGVLAADGGEAGTHDSGAGSADGSTDEDATGDQSDSGVTKEKDGSTTAEVNPYGVPYPTKGIGINARQGTHAGDVIMNMKFVGRAFKNGALTKSPEQIQLADYYDPQQKNGFKVLRILAAAAWANPSEMEMNDMVTATSQLKASGGVFFGVLGDGSQAGVPATMGDLDLWAAAHSPKFSIAIDPQWKALGSLFDGSAVPANFTIDARSMEILKSEVGAPPDIVADMQTWIDWVDSHPATTY